MLEALDDSVVTFANFPDFDELFLSKLAQPTFIS